MSSFELSPQDNNYLTSSILFKQMQQKSINLALSANCVAVNTPKILLDGSGRAYLTGSLQLTGATPAAETEIFSLPNFLSIEQDYSIPVTAVTSGGTLYANSVKLLNATSGISSVVVTAAGSYATLPTISTTGPGSGATFSLAMKSVGAGVVTSQSGIGSYVPGNTITLTGGTFTTAAVLTVTHTQVSSATVSAGGTGGTPGTQTVTGTTGTGTKFQANVTISGGGAITAVNSITVNGSYTVNPTSLTNEPVTGAGLTGAQLNIKMGASTVITSTPGSYTVLPSNPVAQGSTSGSGTGATFNAVWGVLSIGVTAPGVGYDDTSAILISGGGGGSASIVLGSANNQVIGAIVAAGTQNDIISLDGIVFFVNSYN